MLNQLAWCCSGSEHRRRGCLCVSDRKDLRHDRHPAGRGGAPSTTSFHFRHPPPRRAVLSPSSSCRRWLVSETAAPGDVRQPRWIPLLDASADRCESRPLQAITVWNSLHVRQTPMFRCRSLELGRRGSADDDAVPTSCRQDHWRMQASKETILLFLTPEV